MYNNAYRLAWNAPSDAFMPALGWPVTAEPVAPCAGWSSHALARCRQRGIAEHLAHLLLDWGGFEYLPGGYQRVSFRKCDLRKLRKMLPKPEWVDLEKHRHVYAVLDGGIVVTIGYRQTHMKRK